jgi:hypothetical protein
VTWIHAAHRRRIGIGMLVALSILGLPMPGSTTATAMPSARAESGARTVQRGQDNHPLHIEAGAAASAALPAGYRVFSSRVLPYTIGYAPGWKAEGSVWGSMKRPKGEYFDGDIFGRTPIGTISVYAEHLPQGSLLTSQAYTEVALLDLQRARESGGNVFSVRRLGAIAIDGTTAYLLDLTQGTGSDALESTRALWVAHGRGWWASLTTVQIGAGHYVYVPVLETMLRTFRER